MRPKVLAVAILLAMTAFALTPPKHTLVGRWMIYGPDNKPANEYVNFKKDGMYNVVLPDGQIGETGYYKLTDSIFHIKNVKATACGDGYWGKYTLSFHGDDSLSFAVVEDSCTNRRNDIVGGNPGLKRVRGS